MGRPKGSYKTAPSYRLHKATGQAVVTLCAKDHYLGKHETPTSWEKYYRLLAEWTSTGGQVAPSTAPSEITVAEVMAAFWVFAQTEFNGKASLHRYRVALRPLREMYASTKAVDFGCKAYKLVRDNVMKRRNKHGEKLTYRTVNLTMWYVGEVFRWAAEQEMIPASVSHAIQTVKRLERGRSPQTRDPEPVEPVPQEDLDATLPLLPQRVQDICNLMLLCGARPGEMVTIRACDIDMSKPAWIYDPHKHKTQHLGYGRKIALGPKAQEILRPYLTPQLSEYLFKPFPAGRQPLKANNIRWPEAKPRQKRNSFDDSAEPKRGTVSPHFSRVQLSYWVLAACRRADRVAHEQQPDVPADVRIVRSWHPHQLRHNNATMLNNQFGIDVARAVLGHRQTTTTDIYAAKDGVIAARIMSEVG